MRTAFLALLLLLASAPAWATAYYVSPTGSDGANGTSVGTPWLTANHAVNCGDTLTAAAGTYSGTSGGFTQGHWGTVSGCTFPTNEFATLQCITFDACKLTFTTDYNGFWIDKSHWAVMGWEVSGTGGTSTSCFQATPNTTTGGNISFILFANNVANGCRAAGIGFYSQSVSSVYYSVDYVAVIGNIAYNGAGGSNQCGSGISVYQPIAADSFPGTHVYIAGNFSYANVDPNPCNGTAPTDGEGIILDTFDGSQGGFAVPYSQQAVVTNNITFFNGGKGIEVYNNQAGTLHAKMYIYNNTMYGDLLDLNQTFCTGNSELHLIKAYSVEAYSNLAQSLATGCAGNVVYATAMGNGNSTDVVYNSYLSGVSGNNTFLNASGTFAFGPNNTLGTNPTFTNPVNPGAPTCGTYGSVPACMATVIADYYPIVIAAQAYGYHAPSAMSIFDPLYPQWLCGLTLPTGLVTPGCITGSEVIGVTRK